MPNYKVNCKDAQLERLITAPTPDKAIAIFTAKHFSEFYPPYHVDGALWEVCNAYTTIPIKITETLS